MAIQSTDRYFGRIAFIVGLLIFFALALDTALSKSPTNDEPIHLMRGAALAQSGDLSLQYEHPPLSHHLIGLLLPTEPTLAFVANLDARPANDRTAIAWELLWKSGLNVDRALFLARVPIIWAGLLLGAVLALWTQAATRHAAAVVAVMALYATASNLLASAALATTDFVAATTFFATVCAWWFYRQRPSRRRWLITGILLGLALGAKLTGALLIPILFILAYVHLRREPWWRPGTLAIGLLPVAGIVLWAVYLFQIGPWHGLIVPAPTYWTSWESVLTHVSEGHLAFFLGRMSSEGWLLYFPVALLIKTPIPALILCLVALVVLARSRAWQTAAFLLLPVVAILGTAIVSRLNIGFRHILPALPFLMVLGAMAAPMLWRKPITRIALILALGWAIVSGLTTHPDHLAYFNELVGGRGRDYLGDSNLDWGQDLKQLADYAREYLAQTGQPIAYSYTGMADLAYYGLEGQSIVQQYQAGQTDFTPANPPAGRYAINAGDLQGPGLILGALTESDLFDWFRHREPLTTLGGSIFVYDVAQQAEGTWIAHCLSPGPLLADPEAEQLVGRSGLRHLLFDCNTSWVFPENGAPGWYVLPLDMPLWINGWLKEPVPEIVYRHQANAYGPDYAIVYWPGSSRSPLYSDDVRRHTATAAGPATLWAFGARDREWITVWQASETTTAPLSIQAHLISDGEVQVADGLGFPADQWLAGDWFVQRHAFATPGHTLETGLYDYLTLESVGPALRLTAP